MRGIQALPSDPWATRFAVFWYNDREIFAWQQEDFDRQAAALARDGVNHVITFSCTHFRWSFRPAWPRLTETLAKIVTACHAHGLRVTEHHSATLTHGVPDAADVTYMEAALRGRRSALATWPFLLQEPVIGTTVDGVPFASLQQVDGRTGDLARSAYCGWAMCPNSAEYRRAYLKYLATLYQTGIDGIMTDDVQLFGEWHACACPTCRRLFRESTGHTLPAPGPDWLAWHGNYDDPTFVAWLDFRFRSVEGFHLTVKAHYDALGLKLLRPNYGAELLYRNVTAYCVERQPQLDWLSLEFCFSHVIRYSWPQYAVEAAHRFAVARHRGIPAGAYVYPDRPDTVRFTWALARSWGLLWQPLQEGGRCSAATTAVQTEIWAFESDHARLFRRPERIATLGIYDSQATRELYRDFNTRSRSILAGWTLAGYRAGMLFDLFRPEELPGRLDAYRLVVLPEAAVLTAAEIHAFRAFAEGGGILVWVGHTGIKDGKGNDRSAPALAELLELAGFRCAADTETPRTWPLGQGRLVTCGLDFIPTARIHHPRHADAPVFFTVCVDRWQQPAKVHLPAHDVAAHRAFYRDVAAFLRSLHPEPDLGTEGLADDVLVTAFHAPESGELVIHLVNAAGTWDVPLGAPVSHDDAIPFPPAGQALPDSGSGVAGAAIARPESETPVVRLRLRKSGVWAGRTYATAVLLNPDRAEPAPVAIRDDGRQIHLEFAATRVGASGIIALQPRG